MICAYLLKSLKDKKNYIGSTIDLSKRIEQHQLGHVTSTKYRRPLILIGYRKCKNIKEAAQLEKRYKKSSDTLKKAIKRGEFILSNNSSYGE